MKTHLTYLIILFLLAAAAQPIQAQPDDPAMVRTFEGHTDVVWSAVFSPDGRQALSGSYDKTLKLWETASGRLVRTFRGHTDRVYTVAFSPDGRQALSGSYDKTLKLWDVASGRLVRTFEGHTDAVWSVAFSPDGRQALSGSRDNTLKLWETANGQLLRTFKGHIGPVHSVAFSPDGRYALTGGWDTTRKLWETASGRLVRTFEGHTGSVNSVAFSPDGRQALSGNLNFTLKLWETASGRLVRTFEGHTKSVLSVAFSPDGRQVLSGSSDHTLKLWETTSGRLMRTFEGHTGDVLSVAFSSDGRQALSGSRDKTFKLWDISLWTKPDEKPLTEAETLPRPKPSKIPAVKADRIPPVIQIHQPSIARGMKRITRSNKDVLVKGQATDESGIYEVLVNGQEASSLDAQGNFWAEVKLAVGDNRITVKATDMNENAASTAFTVERKPGDKPPPEEPEREPEIQFGEYHALLIAVKDYIDNTLDLRNPIRDARNLKRILLENYTFGEENIHIMENPTRREIRQKFSELRKILGPGDNLLVFYAGHGYWDAELKQGYWLPRDAHRDDDSDWISNSTVRDMIKGVKTQHTMLITDACFSGGIFQEREVYKELDIPIQKLYKIPSRKALTSGNLKAVPDESVFIEFLIKRLKENKERYLYARKLHLSMWEAVTNNSPSNQTPLYGVIIGAGDEGQGDFIFVRKQ